jgi:BioD-like phosphotransacetylase family protein
MSTANDRLQAAEDALERASLNAARAANEITLHGCATVMGERMALIHSDDWTDLQEAIAEWKAAGEELQAALLAALTETNETKAAEAARAVDMAKLCYCAAHDVPHYHADGEVRP